MKFIFILFAACLALPQTLYARPNSAGGLGESAEEAALIDAETKSWQDYDGKIVSTLTVNGLKRTRLKAIQWLVRTRVGAPFSTEQLVRDLQRLYDTGNLYDLSAEVDHDGHGGVMVTINLHDKWTLFPVVGAQGGGGSSTYGAGVYETNLLGYMVNASAIFWEFNGKNSYDLNANQEYLMGTGTMWSLDWQDNIEVQSPHFTNGQSAGLFAWERQQREVMIGTHRPGPFRLYWYMSIYKDNVIENQNNLNDNIDYGGWQQRFYPKMIFGRVDWNNYQEDGFELTAQPTYANLFGSGPQYFALELDFKRVWRTGPKRRDNAAMYLSASHMGESGPNFYYNLGGYYNVRGYSDMREFGDSIAFGNFEWRPYLFQYRWKFLDADLMVVQGCVFSDVGSAWGNSTLTGETVDSPHPLWSAGAGFRVNFVKFAGAILRFDWAQTISPNEGVGFSFGVGQFF